MLKNQKAEEESEMLLKMQPIESDEYDDEGEQDCGEVLKSIGQSG